MPSTYFVMSTTYSGEEMTARAIAFVEKYCSIALNPRRVVDEVDGGGQLLILTQGPILEDSVTVHDLYADVEVPEDSWYVSPDGKIIGTAGRYFSVGHRRYRVTYYAGYEELPEHIEAIVEQIEAMLLKAEGSEGLQSETFGSDYSYVLELTFTKPSPLTMQLNLLRRL